MKADSFTNTKMRFMVENPPFGQPWGGKDAAEGVEEAVYKEKSKANSRWGAGYLPATGDMQLLFIQSAVDKMDDLCGRAASSNTADAPEQIVAVRYKNQIALSFHPELNSDTSIHQYFFCGGA